MHNLRTVSVVIPCYNHAQYLAEAIESALAQTLDDREVIVVNDGSTDNSLDIAKQYPVTIISQPNMGLSAARNSGIAVARGNYILPLDADDTIESTMLERVVSKMNDGVGIVRTSLRIFGDYDQIINPPPVDLQSEKNGNRIYCCSLFAKSVWQEIGGYDELMKDGYEDWEFWIQIMKRGYTVDTVYEPLFNYRKHGHSMIDDTNSKASQIIDYMRNKHKDLYL